MQWKSHTNSLLLEDETKDRIGIPNATHDGVVFINQAFTTCQVTPPPGQQISDSTDSSDKNLPIMLNL